MMVWFAWQEAQVPGMCAGETVDCGELGGAMLCWPWQSSQAGASTLPAASALACMLWLYCRPSCTWHLEQVLTMPSLACTRGTYGSGSPSWYRWQSVHTSRLPCTDAAYSCGSIGLKGGFLEETGGRSRPGMAWHLRQNCTSTRDGRLAGPATALCANAGSRRPADTTHTSLRADEFNLLLTPMGLGRAKEPPFANHHPSSQRLSKA